VPRTSGGDIRCFLKIGKHAIPGLRAAPPRFPIWQSPMGKESDEQYSDEEAKRRFDAALRGARAAEPKPMKDIPPKRREKASSRRTTKKKGP
jgi:hypothetical protein